MKTLKSIILFIAELFYSNIRKEVILGLTLSFKQPLNRAQQFKSSEEEKEKILEILNDKSGEKKYVLVNFCNKSHYLGENRVRIISDMLNLHIKNNYEMQRLQHEKIGVLEMYFTVKKFVENLPIEVLKKTSELVKLGAQEYFENEKGNYYIDWMTAPKKRNTLGWKILQLSKKISTNKTSLHVATGMILSTILSEISEKNGLSFGI
jgi:hypothetical protein